MNIHRPLGLEDFEGFWIIKYCCLQHWSVIFNCQKKYATFTPQSSTHLSKKNVCRSFSSRWCNETHHWSARHSWQSSTIPERVSFNTYRPITERSLIWLLPQTTHLSTAVCAVTMSLSKRLHCFLFTLLYVSMDQSQLKINVIQKDCDRDSNMTWQIVIEMELFWCGNSCRKHKSQHQSWHWLVNMDMTATWAMCGIQSASLKQSSLSEYKSIWSSVSYVYSKHI